MDITLDALENLERSVEALVREEGARIQAVWQTEQVVTQKDVRDVVTEVDVAVERTLRSKLSALLPEAGFVVEEGENTEDREWMWVVDPIDQTKNFVGRVPLFYVQVALTHHGEPVVAVIYNPVSEQVLSAHAGGGTRLNGTRVAVHQKASLAESVIDIDFGGTEDVARKSDVLRILTERAYRVRMTGGAYAPYLVTGGIDAFVVINQKTKPVDQVPRILLTRESGLTFEKVLISDHTFLLYAPHALITELRSCLNTVYGH